MILQGFRKASEEAGDWPARSGRHRAILLAPPDRTFRLQGAKTRAPCRLSLEQPSFYKVHGAKHLFRSGPLSTGDRLDSTSLQIRTSSVLQEVGKTGSQTG